MTESADCSVADVVRRYVSLLQAGSAKDLTALFAENATLEDPVGGGIRRGHESIREFFTTLESLQRTTELNLLRVASREAAFALTITFIAGGVRSRLQPIDTMTFDGAGRIVSLRSYFSPSDIALV